MSTVLVTVTLTAAAAVGVGVAASTASTAAPIAITRTRTVTAPAFPKGANALPLPPATVPAIGNNVQYYLGIPGVPGEARSAGPFNNQIVIYSLSHGASNFSSASGGGSGKVTLSDLSLQSALDRAYPALLTATETGRNLGEVTLTGVSTDPATNVSAPFLKMVLESTTVTSVQIGGAAGGGSPSVSYSLGYQQISVTYTMTGGQRYTSCYDELTSTTCG